MSRDSVILTIGMIGAILTALANQAGLFPPVWGPYISLAALIVGVISGKLATSPLKGDAEIAVDKAIAIDKVIDAKVETGEIIDKGAVNLRNVGPLAIPFLLASMLLPGCAAKQYPTLDPTTQKQIDATEVAKRVNRLMDSAIAGEDAGALTRNQTRLIVTFCVDADKTLVQYPNGWGPTLATAWKTLKEDPVLKPLLLSNQYVSTAATLVDLALAIWTPQEPGPMPAIPWFLAPQTFSMEVA